MKKILILLCLSILVFTSCNSNKSETQEKAKNSISTEKNMGFVVGEDDQPFFLSKIAMNVSNGSGDYAFYMDGLYYYDDATEQTVIVCGKPDCNHSLNEENSKCNAFFSQNEFYYDKGYSYYKENIYILGKGSDNNTSVSLFKISKDGASREEVCKLFEISDINNLWVFTVHRGYAFWSLSTEDGICLFKTSIANPNQIEKVFECEKPGANIARIAGVGEYLYFKCSYCEDEHFENWQGNICNLNINTNETKTLVNSSSSFTVINNNIYYFENGYIYKYCVDDKSTLAISEALGKSRQIVSDNKYLYITNWDNEEVSSDEYGIFVLSTDGDLIDTISIENCEFFRGCSVNRVYMETVDRKLITLDKSQIGTKEHKWKTVYTVSDSGEVILNE